MMLLEEKTVGLRITKDNLAGFVACLGIGTLYAIRAGALPAEAGVWTLGVPRVWEPLANDKAISQRVLKVLQTCDELSAIQKLMPEKFELELTNLIEQLQEELIELEDPVWQIEWLL